MVLKNLDRPWSTIKTMGGKPLESEKYSICTHWHFPIFWSNLSVHVLGILFGLVQYMIFFNYSKKLDAGAYQAYFKSFIVFF